METDIHSNKYNYIIKLLLQAAFVCIEVLILYSIISKWHLYSAQGHIGLILFILFFSLFNIYLLLNILFTPTGVYINSALKEMTIRYPFSSKLIGVDNVKGYTKTVLVTKGGREGGIFIYLKSGRKLLLSTYNLEAYEPIISFLNSCGITDMGKEKYNPFSYLYSNIANS